MGFDFDLVNGVGKKQLICSICLDVLKDPRQLRCRAKHLFCKECITQWIKSGHNNCPVDRMVVRSLGTPAKLEVELIPPEKYVMVIWNQLKIKCKFHTFGCQSICKLSQIEFHEAVCDFHGDRIISCPNGCGGLLMRQHLRQHSCIQSLQERIHFLVGKIDAMENELDQMKDEMHRNSGKSDNKKIDKKLSDNKTSKASSNKRSSKEPSDAKTNKKRKK